MEKVFIKTFGCQMNIYDSERMEGALASGGFQMVPDEKEAEYIIINTCSVRKHAEDRALSYAGKFMGKKKTVIAGCMAQKMKGGLMEKYPQLYAVVGTSGFDMISSVLTGGKGGVFAEETHSYGPGRRIKNGLRGYLAIMKGCDNYCSYCIVPFVRGREVSRDSEQVIGELEAMAASGFREVMLLGQNVNSYSGGINFPGLLKKCAQVKGVERIRFMTSHPKDLTAELVDIAAAEKKICPHFHLAVQSGSDRILKMMNRKYTAREYTEKVEMIRNKIKDVSITTDILVGFPGETEEDFNETVKLVRDIRFDDAYVFKYSERDGTAAAELKDDVSEQEKLYRVNYILDLKKKIGDDINKGYLGREFEVFACCKNEKIPGELETTTENNKKVYVRAPEEKTGSFFTVKITGQKGMAFKGEML